MSEKLRFCYNCDKDQEFIIKKATESFNVKGEKIDATITVVECAVCHEEIWDESLELENEKIIFSAYREKMGFLSPEEILRIRKKYNLTQKSLSILLGFGEKTITRYETGSIQDAPHNLILKLIDNEVCFIQILQSRKNAIPEKLYLEIKNKNKKLFDVITSLPKQSCQPNYTYESNKNNYRGENIYAC